MSDDAPLSFSVSTDGLVAAEQQADKTTAAILKTADAVDALEKKSDEAASAAPKRRNQYSIMAEGADKAAKANAEGAKTAAAGWRVLDDVLAATTPKIARQVDNGLRLRDTLKSIGAEATSTASAVAKVAEALAKTPGGRPMSALSPEERTLDMAKRGFMAVPGGGWVMGGGGSGRGDGGGVPPPGGPQQGLSAARLRSAMPPAPPAPPSFTEEAATLGGISGALGRLPTMAVAAVAGVGLVAAAYAGLVVQANRALEAQEREERRLATITGSRAEAREVLRDSADLAGELGVKIAAATEKIVAFVRAGESLGKTREQMTDIASISEKLGQMSGATSGERNTASGSLVKMLADAKVNASDLKAVLGTVPQVADQIAQGLGVSVSQLRLMVAEGKLTNEQVFSALLKQQKQVDAEFERMPRTVGAAFQTIENDLGELFTRFAGVIPLVREFKMAMDLAAKAAKELNDATRPATPQQRMDAAGGPSIYNDKTNQIWRRGQRPGEFYGAQYDQALSDNDKTFAALRGESEKLLSDVLATVKIAESAIDPLAAKMKSLDDQAEAVSKGIAALATGMTGLPAEEVAAKINTLTLALQNLRKAQDEASLATDPASRALRGVEQRANDRANDPSPAGMALSSQIREFVAGGSNQQQAEAAALALQEEKIKAIVAAKKLEADESTRTLEAVKAGKNATVAAQVEAAVLAFIWQNVGNNVEVSAEQIKEFRDAVSTIFNNKATTGGVNASKPLLDELASVAAAMKVVEQGAYAMRRAEAESKASRSDNGTGKLQMEVFDARQNLADATVIENLKQEIDLTNKLAAAAGDVAAQKRIQLDYDIAAAQRNAGPNGALAIAEQMRAKAEADRKSALAEGRAGLEKQIELVNEEASLIRLGTTEYAVQLATLQKKRDLLKEGADIENDAEAKRQIALAGDLARAQQNLRQAQKESEEYRLIWQNAFDGIQKGGADAFYDILSGAKVDAQSIADSFKKIFLRAFAEIAAAAIIRPLISPIIGAGQSLGVVPQGITGFSGGGGGGGGGGFSMPSLGGGGLGSIGGWFNSPITPTTYSAGYGMAADYASLSGTAIPSGFSSGGMLGGMTWGQGLAGIGSIGMGAYTMATSKSPAGVIGGGLGVLGGGIGMAGAMGLLPMLGAAAGPIGMGLGLVGSLLPMLFGDSGGNQRTHSSTNASLRYGGGNWYTTGGAYGANANSSQSEGALRGLTGGIDSVFDIFGGVKDASKVWGLNASSWTAQGKDWSYTSNATHLVDPTTGSEEAWRMNMGDMMDTGAAQVAIRSVLSGAVGEISSTMKTALESMRAASMGIKETGESIVFVEDVYERLGKGVLTVRAQFRDLDAQFGKTTDMAKRLGLSLDPIIAEQKKATTRLGQDFIDGLIDPIASELRAWEDKKASILADVDYISRHTDVVVDMARVNEALLREEAKLKNDLYNGSVSQLEDALQRLMPGGNLSNLDPSGTLAGLQATYQSTLEKALTKDPDAVSRFGSDATNLAEYAQLYYGGAKQFEDIKRTAIQDIRAVQAAVVGPVMAPSGLGGGTTTTGSNDAQIQQLLAVISASQKETADLRNDLSRTIGLLNRAVGNNIKVV